MSSPQPARGIDAELGDVHGLRQLDHEPLAGARRVVGRPRDALVVVDRRARAAAVARVLRAVGGAQDRAALACRPVAPQLGVERLGLPRRDRHRRDHPLIARAADDDARVGAGRDAQRVRAGRVRGGGQRVRARGVGADAHRHALDRRCGAMQSVIVPVIVPRGPPGAGGSEKSSSGVMSLPSSVAGEVAHAARGEHRPDRARYVAAGRRVGLQDRVAHVQERRLGRRERASPAVISRTAFAAPQLGAQVPQRLAPRSRRRRGPRRRRRSCRSRRR